MNLQVSAGAHTVILSNPEFGVTKTMSVSVKAGETVIRVVPLLP
jgi:hypothetical protein